ncbi:hypothetical protein Tco_1460196 [Tanacetum coccineum]
MHNNIMTAGSKDRPPMLAPEKEAIHLLLTRIGDEIYSTVDARRQHHIYFYEMESQLSVHYSRLYKMMNENGEKSVGSCYYASEYSDSSITSTRMEVNEIRAEKISRIANPLVLVTATQQYLDIYYQAYKTSKIICTTSENITFNQIACTYQA